VLALDLEFPLNVGILSHQPSRIVAQLEVCLCPNVGWMDSPAAFLHGLCGPMCAAADMGYSMWHLCLLSGGLVFTPLYIDLFLS
jgi:hypothetical protein